MKFIRFLLILIGLIPVFSPNVWSMEKDILIDFEESNSSLINISVKENIDEKTVIISKPIKKSESCSHWGLSHWFSGIGEYFGRCCEVSGYGNGEEKGRKYKVNIHDLERNIDEIDETDCCYLAYCGPFGSNPVTGLCCLPIATVLHLSCFPFACCDYSENISKVSTYRGTPRPQPIDRIDTAEMMRIQIERQKANIEMERKKYYYQGSHPNDPLYDRIKFQKYDMREPRYVNF